MQTTNIKAPFSKLLLSVEYCFYFLLLLFIWVYTAKDFPFLLHLALTGTLVWENSLENLNVEKKTLEKKRLTFLWMLVSELKF